MSNTFKENSFDAGSDTPPRFLDEAIKKYVRRAHRSGNHPVYCLFITGDFGSGKTTFMARLGQKLAKYPDTIVVSLHNTSFLFETMYKQLVSAAPKLKSPKANTGHNEIYYQYEVNKALESLKQAGRRAIFCIDDVASTPSIRCLAGDLNEWSLNGFGTSVIMAGLPREIDNLIMTDHLTFLARADRFNMPA